MAIFWRINNNYLDPIFETPNLGFPIEDPSFIPDEYLDKKEFIVFRTCHSIGDWGIISAMPRLLKQKYPDCKVYIPSAKLISKIFNGFNNWNHWDNPFNNVELVFKNNPYINGFIDNSPQETSNSEDIPQEEKIDKNSPNSPNPKEPKTDKEPKNPK